MFKTLTLTNFRKAESAQMVFADGLNVLRGANEASKSTRVEAILYALSGARSLREPLAAVVTYGKPESSLRVVLVFALNGVMYTLTRHKGGAELVGGGATVTGQTEVTARVEQLLGGSADVLAKLAFANQNSVRGALSGGPSAATALIETLSDLSVLDEVVEALVESTPTGNTGVVQGLIAQMEAQVQVEPVEPERAQTAEAELAVLEAQQQQLQAELADVDEVGAKALIQQAQQAAKQAEQMRSRRAALEQVLSLPPQEPATSEDQIQQWQVLHAQVFEHRQVRAAFKMLEDFQMGELLLLPPQEALADRKETAQQLATLETERQNLKQKLAGLAAKRITQTQCGLCQKDLTDVPEVVALNAELDAEAATANTALQEIAEKTLLLQQRLATLKIAVIADEAVRAKFLPPLFLLDETTTPAVPIWAGGDVPEAPVLDYQTLIRDAQDAWRKYRQAASVYEQAQAEVAGMIAMDVPDTAEALAVVAKAQALRNEIAELQPAVRAAKQAAAAEAKAYQDALVEYRTAVASRANALQNLEATRKQLADMHFANELLKKVRAARPVVANKLWATVMSTISRYFTQMRGEPSTVSRGTDGFQVNGRPIGGLSGSTLDILGLAVRIALVKTFLPNLRVLILDEPAAGCDETREMAMLGQLATVDMDQVLVITHSDLADSFADNLIQI